ncbi:MAG: hypothetical protein JRJ39_09095 [Deltaproteobacteria bacterium]|nr:hypothetical protein [Deltaproteobacteria bacterium]MBW1846638.1 hypothetical protein [Deltaproteobacteria bacterium]MBW2180675.1 hypothetical protein [Deltaproteobacteria bacterium]
MKKNIHFLFFFALAICLSSFMLPSCAIRSTAPPPKDKAIRWEIKSPTEVLDQLQLEQKRIADFTAGFSIILDPPPKGQPSNLQGVLFFSRNKKGPFVRVKSISVFGRVMFDLIQKGDFVQIYIPSRQTLYSGRMGKEIGNDWQKVFTSLFADVSLMAVNKNADLVINKDTVILPLTEGVFHLDRKTGFVLKWVQEKRVLYYEDYIATPELPPFPTRILIRSSDNLNKASCVFNQVQINKDIHNVFDLSEYRPKFKKDISELKR